MRRLSHSPPSTRCLHDYTYRKKRLWLCNMWICFSGKLLRSEPDFDHNHSMFLSDQAYISLYLDLWSWNTFSRKYVDFSAVSQFDERGRTNFTLLLPLKAKSLPQENPFRVFPLDVSLASWSQRFNFETIPYAWNEFCERSCSLKQRSQRGKCNTFKVSLRRRPKPSCDMRWWWWWD